MLKQVRQNGKFYFKKQNNYKQYELLCEMNAFCNIRYIIRSLIVQLRLEREY